MEKGKRKVEKSRIGAIKNYKNVKPGGRRQEMKSVIQQKGRVGHTPLKGEKSENGNGKKKGLEHVRIIPAQPPGANNKTCINQEYSAKEKEKTPRG